jgi:hypothetical protein
MHFYSRLQIFVSHNTHILRCKYCSWMPCANGFTPPQQSQPMNQTAPLSAIPSYIDRSTKLDRMTAPF